MKVKRLIEMIAAGSGSQSVMAAITEREATLREIANQTVEPGPDSVQEKLDELRSLSLFYKPNVCIADAGRTQ